MSSFSRAPYEKVYTVIASADQARHAAGQAISTTQADFAFPLPLMLGAPTYAFTGTVGHFGVIDATGSMRTATVITFNSSTKMAAFLRVTVASGLTQGDSVLFANNTGDGVTNMTFTA